jgi:hypothetical protein
MRVWRGLVALACCVASAGGTAYLHGFERALGHEDRQYRPALIQAYSDEVVFRAGPCVVLAVAVPLATWFGVLPNLTAATAILGAVLSAAGTHLTIQRYVVTPPGQFMPTTVWDGVTLLTWVAAALLMLAVVALGVRKSQGAIA